MSWNDLMKRLVIGKQTNKNFSYQDLPHNRKQVFKFIYKNRLIEQFNAGLLAIIFFIPLFVWQLLNDSLKSAVDITKLNSLEIYNEYLSILTTKNIINIPCIMFASLGLAGLVYIIRKLCFNEPVSVFKDFCKGIKNSWAQYLIIGLILGLNIYLVDWIFNYLFNYPEVSAGLQLALIIFMGLLTLSMLIIYMYAYGIAGLYQTNYIQIFKGAFVITFKKFFTNILMVIASILPISVWFMPFVPLIVKIIGLFVLVFGLLSYAIIVSSLFIYAQFDKFINEKNYPELVNKGIYTEENIEDDIDTVTEQEIEKLAEEIASSYDEESTE